MMSILNIATYRFVSLKERTVLKRQFHDFCSERGLKGSIMLSPEGINLMLAGVPEMMEEFKLFLENFSVFKSMEYKASFSDEIPFKRLFVKIKQQLTPFKKEIVMSVKERYALTPHELKRWLDEEKKFTLLDVRNQYEIDQGTFKRAISLQLKHFRDFEEAVTQLPEAMKSQPLVTFCTGGIRCEKVVPFLRQNGFQEVYQLEGGILQYFHDCGEVHYAGGCYVFDERTVVKPKKKDNL